METQGAMAVGNTGMDTAFWKGGYATPAPRRLSATITRFVRQQSKEVKLRSGEHVHGHIYLPFTYIESPPSWMAIT